MTELARTDRSDDGPSATAAGPSSVFGSPDAGGVRLSARPLHVVLALAALVILTIGGDRLDDLDAYWHVEIGREILRTHQLSNLGQSWLGVDAPNWRTSQWLSEVAMALAVNGFGWRALVIGRLFLVIAVLAAVAVTLLRRGPLFVSAPVVFLIALMLPGITTARPQTVSLFFVTLLGAAGAQL
jgi:hypothetical protein